MLATGNVSSVLVVAPHGDDEALGAGALIAKCESLGIPVHVLFFAVDASNHYGLSRETTVAERCREIKESARILGFTFDIVFLGQAKLEKLDTVPLRDLVDVIEHEVDSRSPDLVALPHGDDYDQDHVACFRAGHAALRPIPSEFGKHFVGTVLTYEMPKLEWAIRPFRPNTYLPMDRQLLDRKCEAIAAYTTQLRQQPHIRSLENMRRLAGIRGGEIGVDYAEAYSSIRWVL